MNALEKMLENKVFICYNAGAGINKNCESLEVKDVRTALLEFADDLSKKHSDATGLSRYILADRITTCKLIASEIRRAVGE